MPSPPSGRHQSSSAGPEAPPQTQTASAQPHTSSKAVGEQVSKSPGATTQKALPHTPSDSCCALPRDTEHHRDWGRGAGNPTRGGWLGGIRKWR